VIVRTAPTSVIPVLHKLPHPVQGVTIAIKENTHLSYLPLSQSSFHVPGHDLRRSIARRVRGPDAADPLVPDIPAKLLSVAVVLRRALDDGDLVDAVRVAVDVEGVEGVGPGAPVDLVSMSANATRFQESGSSDGRQEEAVFGKGMGKGKGEVKGKRGKWVGKDIPRCDHQRE